MSARPMTRASVMTALAAASAMMTEGCWGLAESRAHLDEEVGIAQSNGLSVRVIGGLAAVRRLAPDELVLWAQAPTLDIEIEASAAQRLSIVIDNCLPDAQLTARTAGGDALDVAEAPRPTDAAATHRAWTVSAIAGERIALRVSSPDAAVVERWRFAVVNDPHGADGIRALAPSLNADLGLKLVVSAGDISGNGENALAEVQDALRVLRVPFYATIGNNDAGLEGWHGTFGRHSFHFAFRGVELSFVDSASASVDPMVYGWLDEWIQQAGARPHVVVTHVPPLDPLGSRGAGFRSRSEAAKFLNHLAAGGTRLLLCGHVHQFHSVDEAGIPTVISGAHGQYAVVEIDPVQGAIFAARGWSAAH